MIAEQMKDLRDELGVSYQVLCRACGVAYSSLMRWKGRHLRGEPAVRQPGPAKIQPLDLEHLEMEIRALSHRHKRSAGVSGLWEKYQSQVSRRQLRRMIAQVRSQERRSNRNGLQRITWQCPGLVWSMDDMEFDPGDQAAKIHVHGVQDLGSRYKFPPLIGDRLAGGLAVATHLAGLFRRYGAPLFLKRDNHGNLNDCAVDAVMGRYGVLPLNSPCHHARYNGAMERAQRELREELLGRLNGIADTTQISIVVERVVHELNHQPRPCLDGQTSCVMFSLGMHEARTYARRKRKEVCDWIKSLAARIMAQDDGARPLSVAQCWRIAAQTWLQRHGVISVAKGMCHLVP